MKYKSSFFWQVECLTVLLSSPIVWKTQKKLDSLKLSIMLLWGESCLFSHHLKPNNPWKNQREQVFLAETLFERLIVEEEMHFWSKRQQLENAVLAGFGLCSRNVKPLQRQSLLTHMVILPGQHYSWLQRSLITCLGRDCHLILPPGISNSSSEWMGSWKSCPFLHCSRKICPVWFHSKSACLEYGINICSPSIKDDVRINIAV